MMKRILILTCDLIGEKMAGPAIRVLETARILSQVHNVVIGCPEISGSLPDLPENVTVEPYGSTPRWAELDDYHGIILPGSMKVDAHIETPVLVDLYDPYILSNLSRTDKSESVQHQELLILKSNIQRGDFFVCASDRQRNFWLGLMAAEGRLNVAQFQADPHLRKLIDIAPFGIPGDRPETPGNLQFPGHPDAFKLVWAGGIWDWFDPLTLIHAVSQLNQKNIPVTLFFMGTQHPNPRMTQMSMVNRARELARELSLLDQSVFFGDWIPYDRRGEVLSAADAGVSTHFPHLETHFSFRTRILDYIWACKPYICTRGDAFADLAENRQIGWAVEPENIDALETAIASLVSDRNRYQACIDNLRTVAEEMCWQNVLKPIIQFCENPQRSPDRERPGTITQDNAVFASGCETSSASAGEILGLGIEQTIPCQQSGLCRIDLKLATYDRLNSGVATLELKTTGGFVISVISFDVRTVEDNEWKSFCFGPLPILPDQRLILSLVHHGASPGNAFTVWMDTDCENSEFIHNGVTCPGSINYRLYTMPYSHSDVSSLALPGSANLLRKVRQWLKR